MASHAAKRAVTVNTTNRCNLRCSYCMASSQIEQGNPIRIPLDFAKRGIEDAIFGKPTGFRPPPYVSSLPANQRRQWKYCGSAWRTPAA